MADFLRALVPWLAHDRRHAHRFWRACCVALYWPVTALLHHRVFHRPTCMLNNFGDAYTDPSTLLAWVMQDASLGWGIAASVAIFHIGKRHDWLKIAVIPGVPAFLPYAIWIWDVPLTGRFICRHFHDSRVVLAPGTPLRSVHVLGLCVILYAVFAAINVVRARRVPSRGPIVPSHTVP